MAALFFSAASWPIAHGVKTAESETVNCHEIETLDR